MNISELTKNELYDLRKQIDSRIEKLSATSPEEDEAAERSFEEDLKPLKEKLKFRDITIDVPTRLQIKWCTDDSFEKVQTYMEVDSSYSEFITNARVFATERLGTSLIEVQNEFESAVKEIPSLMRKHGIINRTYVLCALDD